MDTPEKIPLEEAVARDLIPCSVCGAKGADVRQVEGRKHFLCAACAARGRRWTWGVVAALVVILAAVLFLRFRRGDDSPEGDDELKTRMTRDAFQQQIVTLLEQRRFREARAQLGLILSRAPGDPLLNLLMGRTCMSLGYFEASIPTYQAALAGDPKDEAECRMGLGTALLSLGHSAQALPYLEKAFDGSRFEKSRPVLLAECYLDLERFADALKVLDTLPPDPAILRHRHRALLYMGKPEEARRVYETLGPELPGAVTPPGSRAVVLAMQAREEGDFARALKLIQDAAALVDPKSFDALRLKHMSLQVYVDSGDLDKLEETAAELSQASGTMVAGEATYYRALGRLMAGKREEAVAVAKEFLGRFDLEVGLLRREAFCMQHLAGVRKDDEVAGEAAQVNRFWANDFYFYLALATGSADWAKKAADVTPGHNFPYHAVQRLLKK